MYDYLVYSLRNDYRLFVSCVCIYNILVLMPLIFIQKCRVLMLVTLTFALSVGMSSLSRGCRTLSSVPAALSAFQYQNLQEERSAPQLSLTLHKSLHYLWRMRKTLNSKDLWLTDAALGAIKRVWCTTRDRWGLQMKGRLFSSPVYTADIKRRKILEWRDHSIVLY